MYTYTHMYIMREREEWIGGREKDNLEMLGKG